MNTPINDLDQDYTIPPTPALRFANPNELYQKIPEISGFTKHRPTEGEDAFAFFERLRGSTTPEDAITYTSFAVEPVIAINWAMEAVRITLPEIPPNEMPLFTWVSQWIDHPSAENRWRTMQTALFAPRRSATVYLGLAVGWSGGALAPNDPVTMPEWRCPKAVNAAVLRALGQVSLDQRSVSMARVLDLAAGLFRVYD
ncbi:hypothetical protein [Nereida sp. MMG025]|uniref:DUF6931 family protein n=1 Tax=Nereida sp. MMG025 TaxID=2909981 RepID=UPI001F36A104|nr:hypothetical protein [Nereida sp. MMG025]MCF6445716.1 hypothetical protein [Nereida sp. MMG025]